MTPARHIRTPFMDPLVLAIRDDHKRVTRRLIKLDPSEEIIWSPSCGWHPVGPKARPGDILDVCEALISIASDHPDDRTAHYRCDRKLALQDGWAYAWDWKVNVLPARYCPSWAVRHHRRLISVRPERLSEVTDAEATLEGIRHLGWPETREGFIEGFMKMHKLESDRVWVERREWAPGEVKP